jgi:hypothetical protein
MNGQKIQTTVYSIAGEGCRKSWPDRTDGTEQTGHNRPYKIVGTQKPGSVNNRDHLNMAMCPVYTNKLILR